MAEDKTKNDPDKADPTAPDKADPATVIDPLTKAPVTTSHPIRPEATSPTGPTETGDNNTTAGITAAQLARANGTVMDGASGSHVLGFNVSEEVGKAVADGSREQTFAEAQVENRKAAEKAADAADRAAKKAAGAK